MNVDDLEDFTEYDWARLRPVLEAAVAELDPGDRARRAAVVVAHPELAGVRLVAVRDGMLWFEWPPGWPLCRVSGELLRREDVPGRN